MRKKSLTDLFPHMPPEYEPVAVIIYRTLFGDLPFSAWSKHGTTMTRAAGRRKLHFAPRRTYCTIGFRGRGAIEFYRFLGGELPGGEVTIKIPYDREWDAEAVKKTIEWYLAQAGD